MSGSSTFYRAILFLLLCGALPSGIFADDSDGIKTSTDLGLLAATTLQLKTKITETITIPFLVGEGALLSDNSLAIKLGAEVSPVSLNGTVDFVWMPIAFAQLVAGGSVGTGWNIPVGNGLRMNERRGVHDAALVDASFDGMVWSARAGGVVQFDLGVIKPGRWTHVLASSFQSVRYRALTSAGDEESWLYESDDGENRNGWNYYANYFFGYRMPLVVDIIGVYAEQELFLYGDEDGEVWGDDLSRWIFGPMAHFAITDRLSLALLVQWRSMRVFTDETEDYEFYQDRELKKDNARRVEWYRVAINANYKLK